MLTYTQLLNEYLVFTKDKTAENQTFGATQLNVSIKARLGEEDWIFLEKVRQYPTIASQQGYYLPADYAQMRTVTVTQGTTVWSLLECPSRQAWDMLNTITYTSDIAEYYYIQNNQVLLYPIPSSNGNTITYNYKKKVPKLNIADYTTGTISITSGDETVTGVGTTFTSAMVGRSLMTTDGLWYEIGTFTDATHLELLTPYLGSTVSGGTYTIGQLSPIPDAYEDMPAFDASTFYFTMQGGFEKAKGYRELADDLSNKMKSEQGSKSTSPRIRHAGDTSMLNPNLFIRL